MAVLSSGRLVPLERIALGRPAATARPTRSGLVPLEGIELPAAVRSTARCELWMLIRSVSGGVRCGSRMLLVS